MAAPSTIEDQASATSRAMPWTGRVLSGLFVLFMILDITIRLLNRPIVAATMAALGCRPT